MLEISVLGPVEVRRDGELLGVPGGKTAELLIALALEAGTIVRADRLVDDLWGGAPTNRNTLQQKVARLRRGLGDPAAVAGSEDGYRLAVDPAEVDVHRVLRDAAIAAAQLDEGDHAGAAATSAAALALLPGGDVLAGAGDWAQPHRVRIEAVRATLTQTAFAARVRLGEDVTAELEAAVALAPHHEGLWELLITALYRAGRQADALAAYQRVRARLADDLGLEPGPRLKEIEREILTQDAGLGAPDGNLPSLAARLVARDAEVAAVATLLAEHRLVEVVGPGGVGKTALALATGRRLGVPVWLVRLEGARTADDVLDTVLAALRVVGREPALYERLRRADCVVILDNCEHVVDAVAALAERLLDAAPGLRVLCTSQVPLDVPGEAVFELQPLALDDAVALFAVRAARPGEDADEILALCRALDGLPLAIELAAARTRTLPVAEIARRLDDRFAVLADPTSRRPERRRALRATIGWSYELLFPDDQRGLWALATFADGAPLEAVEAVLGALGVPPAAAIDVVGRLAARSLVIVDAPSRYRLLDSIRAFALEALDEAGLTARGRAAHAAWYAARAAGSTAGVRGADQAKDLAFARDERANVDAALAWCAAHDPVLGLDLAVGFGWAWIVLGDARGAQRLHAALDAAGETAPAAHARAQALLLAAWIEASAGRLDAAAADVTAARTCAAGDPVLEGRCDYHMAYVVSHRGDWEEGLALTARAAERLTDPWDHATNALFAARAAISAGDVDRARAARDAVERWLQDVDDPWLHVRRDAMLGELARVERRFDAAVTHLARATATSGRLGFLQTEAYQLTSLGRAQCQAGDYAAGPATLQHGVAKAEATGDPRLAALGRVHLGRVLRALGRPDDARTALHAAAAFHRQAGGGEQETLGDTLLAALDDDRDRLVALLEVARAAGDAPAEVFALDALGRLAGDAALHAAADQRMAVASHFIAERDRVDRRRAG